MVLFWHFIKIFALFSNRNLRLKKVKISILKKWYSKYRKTTSSVQIYKSKCTTILKQRSHLYFYKCYLLAGHVVSWRLCRLPLHRDACRKGGQLGGTVGTCFCGGRRPLTHALTNHRLLATASAVLTERHTVRNCCCRIQCSAKNRGLASNRSDYDQRMPCPPDRDVPTNDSSWNDSFCVEI